jgi:hypothetical protein
MGKDKSPDDRGYGHRAKWALGDPCINVYLKLPYALSGTPSRDDIETHCRRLNRPPTFVTGAALSPDSLRKDIFLLNAAFIHSQNPIFLIKQILLPVAAGYYPTLQPWITWLIPALQKFYHDRITNPRELDRLLNVNSGGLFDEADEYILLTKVMFDMYIGIASGESISAVSRRVFDSLPKPLVSRIKNWNALRQRYYKEGWADFFPHILKCGLGGEVISEREREITPTLPDMEIVAEYPPRHTLILDDGIDMRDKISMLTEMTPYTPIYRVTDHDGITSSMDLYIQNKNPIGALTTLLWADHYGYYPPAIALFWIIQGLAGFLYSRGGKPLSELLGFSPNTDPWTHTATEIMGRVMAMQAYVCKELFKKPITQTVKKQEESIRKISCHYLTLTTDFTLRNNYYKYRDELSNSDLLDRARDHAQEYLNIFSPAKKR